MMVLEYIGWNIIVTNLDEVIAEIIKRGGRKQ